MTFSTKLPTSPAAARSASAAHRAGSRRGIPFDLRGGQTDDDHVALFEVAGDDFGVVAVGDAGADLDRLELLRRRIGKDPDGLHALRSVLTAAVAPAAEGAARTAGAADAATALAHPEGAALRRHRGCAFAPRGA